MQLKKEMRWMAFLLVPLIILLALHFFIPLQFVLNSYPVLTQDYNNRISQMQQDTARAHAVANQRILQAVLRKERSVLTRLVRFYEGFTPSSSVGTNNPLAINDGCQFAREVGAGQRSSSDRIKQSMWFSSTCGEKEQLTA